MWRYDYSTSYPEGEGLAESDGEVDLNVLDDSGYELVLPSGAKVGHRSLVRWLTAWLHMHMNWNLIFSFQILPAVAKSCASNSPSIQFLWQAALTINLQVVGLDWVMWESSRNEGQRFGVHEKDAKQS